MFSRRLHNVFVMPLLRLYYAYITLLLHYFEQHKYLYSALSGIVAMWCTLESSRCGALWNRRDVVLFWNRLYRALSLELSRCDALGIVAMCLSRESSRCSALFGIVSLK